MISVRAYADSRGISHTAVQKAIKSGRLVKCLGKSAGGAVKIADPDLADKEWAANTDQSKPLNVISGEPRRRRGTSPEPFEPRQSEGMPAKAARKAALVPDAESAGETSPPDTGGGPSYAKSRAIREAYQARLAKLEFEDKAGKMLAADAVRVVMFNASRKCRDMLMGLPDRIAPLVVGLNDQHEIHRLLTDEVRRACAEIAKLKPPEKAD